VDWIERHSCSCTYLQAQNWAEWTVSELASGAALLPASTAGPAPPSAGLGVAEANGLLARLEAPAGSVGRDPKGLGSTTAGA